MSSTPYTVLARRYRPQTFDDVVGQGHIGQALRNAIKAGRVAHAYLFTGARGVGKTSTARIFAKALNCPRAVDAVPCNECEICQGVSTGGDVDVLEIDGASNRGIDDIRQLRANVNVKSMRSRHKVYIIDEVHMLTKEAFNALLKTLEEPPPNVKFVFCTTEPHKVPDTILSRCQRFDFGTIATGTIAERLASIATAEGIRVDPDAVDLVARRAGGSMRDSQSLFDQLLAFGEEHITTADVHKLLGTAPDERLVELFDALLNRDRAAALHLLAEALDRGVQLGPFSDQVLEYLRDLLIVLTGADGVPLVSVSEALRPQLGEQGTRWGIATVTAAMQILAETKGRMQRVNFGRALLELAIVRISLLEELDDIGRLVQQMSSGSLLAHSGAAGGSASAPGTAAGSPGTGRRSDALRQKLQGSPEKSPAAPSTGRASSGEGNTSGGTSPMVRQSSVERRTEAAAPADAISYSPQTDSSGAELPEVRDSAEADAVPAATAGTQAERSGGDGSLTPTTAEVRAVDPGPDPDTPLPAEVTAVIGLTSETMDAFWAQVLKQVPDKLANSLKNATNVAISGPSRVEITFPRSYVFSMNYCQREEPLQQLSRLARELAGKPVEIRFRVDQNGPSATPRSAPASPRADHSRLRPKVVENDPFVQQAAAIFGGSVVEVRRVLAEVDTPTQESNTDTEEDSLPGGELEDE